MSPDAARLAVMELLREELARMIDELRREADENRRARQTFPRLRA